MFIVSKALLISSATLIDYFEQEKSRKGLSSERANMV